MNNEETVLVDLQLHSAARVIAIRDQAREVVCGHAQTISGLTKRVAWTPASADIVLRVANQPLADRNSSTGPTDPVSLQVPLGQYTRFPGPVIQAQGVFDPGPEERRQGVGWWDEVGGNLAVILL